MNSSIHISMQSALHVLYILNLMICRYNDMNLLILTSPVNLQKIGMTLLNTCDYNLFLTLLHGSMIVLIKFVEETTSCMHGCAYLYTDHKELSSDCWPWARVPRLTGSRLIACN